MAEKEIKSLIMRLRIQFNDYRGWRIVNVEDENGIKREHLLIPMLENGIEFAKNGPKQNLMLMRSYSPNLDKNTVGILFPYISKKNAMRMVGLGLLQESEMSSYRYPTFVGFAYKPFFNIRRKRDSE